MDWLAYLNTYHSRVPLGERVEAEVLHWAYQERLPDNWPHRHTYFEACMVGRHGRGVFIVEGSEHSIAPGDLFIARPGVVHQIRNTQEPLMELYWVAFQLTPTTGEMPRTIREFVRSETFLTRDPKRRVAAVWTALRALAQSGHSDAAAPLASALLLAYAEAMTPTAPVEPQLKSAAPGAARLAVRYISDNLDRPLRVDEVARHVNMSPRHLSRIIRKLTGTTFSAYVTQARIDRARILLLRTDLPVKEVAHRVGYRNVQHFTTAFTQHIGSPPAAFRKGKRRANIQEKRADGEFV